LLTVPAVAVTIVVPVLIGDLSLVLATPAVVVLEVGVIVPNPEETQLTVVPSSTLAPSEFR
jgi:hypothetical protein